MTRAGLGKVVNLQSPVTTDTALRLATYFGTSPEMWLHLQSSYELSLAQESLLPTIRKEVQRRNA